MKVGITVIEFKPKTMTVLKNYNKSQFFKDLNAGVIVAIIALPLSIALAIASGVSPEQGLYTAIIGGFIIALLGGSRVQIGGPSATFMVVVFGVVATYGLSGLAVATMMAGLFMILMGVFKIGNYIKFIPYPITTGFTSGIAVTIFTSQIVDFLGMTTPPLPVSFIGKWWIYIKSFHTFDWTTLSIGILAILLIQLWPKVNRKIPGALVALIITTILVQVLDLNVATIGSRFTNLPTGLPRPRLHLISGDMLIALVQPAIVIAFLGSIESLLSAVVADGMIGGKHRSNTELIAQGIANIATGLFGGIPATGAIARTAANVRNGGRTPVAGMVHAITLLLIMLLLMPLAKMIPLAALAAIVIIVAYNMGEWHKFFDLLKAPLSDITVLLLTFFLTILVDLAVAIEVGMVVAALVFMKRMADATTVGQMAMDAAEDTQREGHTKENDQIENQLEKQGVDETDSLNLNNSLGVQVYEIHGPFFFGAADTFIEQFKLMDHRTDAIILRMRHVSMIDATAMNAFKSFIHRCKKMDVNLYLTGLKPGPYDTLERSKLLNEIGIDNLFPSVEEALLYHKQVNKKGEIT